MELPAPFEWISRVNDVDPSGFESSPVCAVCAVCTRLLMCTLFLSSKGGPGIQPNLAQQHFRWSLNRKPCDAWRRGRRLQ